MNNIPWTVSIIAQYSENEEIVKLSYCNLIDSIIRQRNPSINFHLLRYHKEKKIVEFFSFEYSSPHSNRKIIKITPKTIGDFYSSPAYLIEFFEQLSLQGNTEHHFLITWGHGAGLGLFSEGDLPQIIRKWVASDMGSTIMPTSQNINYYSDALDFYNRMFSSGAGGYFGSIFPTKAITDYFIQEMNIVFPEDWKDALKSDFRIIPIEFFVSAFEQTFQRAGKKIEYMYTMNCFMQMFETGYLLRNHVKYFIGAENFQFFLGPDYDSLFQDLSSQPDVDDILLREIGNRIVVNYKIKYAKAEVFEILIRFVPRHATIVHLKEFFLVATDLRRYEKLNEMLNQVAEIFITNKKLLYPLIRRARDKCKHISNPNFGIIDIIHFLTQLLEENLQTPALQTLIHNIISDIKNPQTMINNTGIPTSLCIPVDFGVLRHCSCPQGISFFFPKDATKSEDQRFIDFFMREFYKPDVSNSFTSFLSNSSWASFVRDYFFSDIFRTR